MKASNNILKINITDIHGLFSDYRATIAHDEPAEYLAWIVKKISPQPYYINHHESKIVEI